MLSHIFSQKWEYVTILAKFVFYIFSLKYAEVRVYRQHIPVSVALFKSLITVQHI